MTGFVDLADDCLAQLRHPFGDHHPIFVPQPVYLMHQSRAGPSQALAYTMKRLVIVLVVFLRRHKTHGGPRHRFANACGITPGIFACYLTEGLTNYGAMSLTCMVMCTEPSSPKLHAPPQASKIGEHRGQCGA